jgi:hypothetical protein
VNYQTMSVYTAASTFSVILQKIFSNRVGFNPPAVVNDAELPVCNDNDNE